MGADPSEHLRGVIAKSLPPYARVFQISSQEDFVLQISWQLERDYSRRSKVIELTIASEAITTYVSANEATRRIADVRLADAIREKLVSFDPDPGAGEGAVVSWLMGSLTPG